ncbi:hypothetical protein CDV31_005881 [Fusarium ambrosium]|uniref:Uncharacterized protein n=1 Tax=Fusarium ambrosium TaxID=131363 RepID=A0A428UGN8_9HYPO|nr:hypothetical protein CDV31_005881 [Fusarium ambrosium]
MIDNQQCLSTMIDNQQCLYERNAGHYDEDVAPRIDPPGHKGGFKGCESGMLASKLVIDCATSSLRLS